MLFSFLFSFYPGTVEDYYVVFLFPFIAIASSILISRMPKVFALSLLSLFILSNVYHVLTYTNNRGLTAKKNLIEKVSRQLKSPFYLSYETELDIEGWRYLFEAYGKKPAQSKSDAMFGWLYPQDIASKSPPLKVNVSNNFKVSILPNN